LKFHDDPDNLRELHTTNTTPTDNNTEEVIAA
jgi:hypothetical protein